MPSLNSLRQLLVEQIQDLYDAENQLVKALPQLAEAATHSDLKQGFLDHLEQTVIHVARLEEVFESLDSPVEPKLCKAMKGLIAESAEAIGLSSPAAIKDACLIGAARRVEHYEIAAYSSAVSIAEKLGTVDVAELLQRTLEEEEITDKALSAVAEEVNGQALAAGATVR